MTVERWHKDLKYNSDLQGKCGGRLDKAIHSLLKNLRLKVLNRLTSIQRGKLKKKMCVIRKMHKIADKLKEHFQTFIQSENIWIITSLSEVGETYKITIKNLDSEHNCNLACNICNICLHKITCTCPNYTIKYNMCKHIHAFCLKERPFSNLQQNGISNSPSTEKGIKEKPQHETLENLKSSATSLIMSFIPEIQEYSEEQCKELIKDLSILKHKCKAIKAAENSQKSLPPVASTCSNLKKITPQRTFPLKKKKLVKKLQANYKQADTLSNIILSKSETYEVPRANTASDHAYFKNL
ncbi:uncharacterized protein LOC129968922 [Argiope bruennichi]|uniref:uncharacterized protein LOC129968922 n=1 Tax=Argiope bruennichi TaxID=94029 RepID=UPI0024953F17|nr:uncharacterized protein LOC129968922 [Argiope bruennichi]